MRMRATIAFHAHRPLLAILLAFLLLATFYNLSLPVYEAPDEHAHFVYVKWLADGRGLPNLERDLENASHEIGQPPLYYALLAPFIAPIDTSDMNTIAPINPYFRKDGGINVHYHTAAERFPYRDTALAIHLARFVSTLMATVTIVATYGLAWMIIPRQAMLAAALVAFNPQFIFIASAISNDTLVAAMSALTLLLMVWILTSAGPGRWRYLLLGVLWGLSVLAKVSALGLGSVIAVALLLKARWQRSWTELIKGGLAVAFGLAAVAGWWFLRNWALYGHPLAWGQFLTANRGLLRVEPLSWVETFGLAAFLRKSYWAMFAYGIHSPPPFYWLVSAMLLLALLGLFLWLILKRYRQMTRRQIASIVLLALWSLVVIVLLMDWIRQVREGNQGRLMFPAVSSLAVLMALGLANLGRRWPGLILVSILAVWAAALPLIVTRPAFELPALLPMTTGVPNPVDVRYNQEIALLGYEMEDRTVVPGERLELTLYWQALQPISESYVVRLFALDSTGNRVAELDAVPYRNRYPTPVWQLGHIFAETYRLPPIREPATPGVGSVEVSLYPVGRSKEKLPATLTEGSIGDAFAIAYFRIPSTEPQDLSPEHPTDATFDARFRLIGYDLPESIGAGRPFTATLYWESLVPDGQDYTVFIHVYDEQGQLVAQADGAPQNGDNPTSFWSADEMIKDPHLVNIPDNISEGNYQVAVGLYEPYSSRRLTAIRPDGAQWPDGVAVLGGIVVE